MELKILRGFFLMWVRLPPRAPVFPIEDERVTGPLLSVYLWCTPLCKRTSGSPLQASAKSASGCSCHERTHAANCFSVIPTLWRAIDNLHINRVKPSILGLFLNFFSFKFG